jgi:hypothetical protein
MGYKESFNYIINLNRLIFQSLCFRLLKGYGTFAGIPWKTGTSFSENLLG